MPQLSILLVISLLCCTGLVCRAHENDGSITSPTTHSSNSILSADRYDQHKTFGTADFLVTEPRHSYTVILRLENYEKQSFKECAFNVNFTTSELIRGVHGLGLTRYTDSNRFMLAWYDEVYNSGGDLDHRPQVIGMDMSNCRSYDLKLSGLTRNPVISAPDQLKFLVILKDEEYCGQFGQCYIAYDENFVETAYAGRFDNSIVWPTKLNWGNNKVWYHGFDHWGHYTLRQSSKPEAKEIDVFFRANKAIQVLPMGDMYCVVGNPSVDVSVNCTLIKGPQYKEGWGDTIAKWSLKFEHPVKPLALRVLNDSVSDYEFVLFSADTSCTSDESCWKLKRTRVTKDSVSTVEQKFECIGDWKDLEIDRAIRDERYWYVCRQGIRYVYNVNKL